jgi:hypothetical protein
MMWMNLESFERLSQRLIRNLPVDPALVATDEPKGMLYLARTQRIVEGKPIHEFNQEPALTLIESWAPAKTD